MDAINISVKIVVDYEHCVYANYKKQNQNQNGSRNKPSGYSRRNNGPQYRPFQSFKPGEEASRPTRSRNTRKRCFGCNMVGHIFAECWNAR